MLTGDFIHVLGYLPNTQYIWNTNTTRIFESNFCTTLPHVDYANILNFNLLTFGWTRTQTRTRFFGKFGLDFALRARKKGPKMDLGGQGDKPKFTIF